MLRAETGSQRDHWSRVIECSAIWVTHSFLEGELHGWGRLGSLSNWFSSSCVIWAPQVALEVKNLAANSGDPWWGRSPGGGHGNPFLYSCLENPMDGRNWKATVHRVAQNLTQLKQHTPACTCLISGNVLIWGGCLWNACLGNQNLKFRLFYLYFTRLGTWCFSRQCVLSIYPCIFHPNSICAGHTSNPLSAVWRQS